MGIMPSVFISLDFNRDYQKFEEYTSAVTTEEKIGRSNNFTELGITFGMGRLSLANNDNGFDYGVDLWYFLNLPMYNNDFNYTDSTGVNRIGTSFKGKVTHMRIPDPDSTDDPPELIDVYFYNEFSEKNHIVIPYLYASWTGNRIALAAELGLSVGFASARDTEMALTTGTSNFVKNGANSDTKIFAFSPTLDLGMQWEIAPDKLFFNAGANIGFGSLSLVTINSETYNNNVKDPNSEVETIDNSFESASTRLNIGFTFNITQNLSVQAISGVEIGNNINVFSTTRRTDGTANGLAVFSEILATVKF